MASSDVVNYATRPNKAVERRLVFEVLSALSPSLDLSNYQYVGLGAPWFVDFIMAHKILSISDMVSIERDHVTASRAFYNRPYGCVRVIEGDSFSVLPGLDLEARPLLAWMDYDSGPEGPVLDDLATLLQRACTGSVIVVTLNAHRGRLPTHDEEGEEYGGFGDRMRSLFGNLVPQVLPKGAAQTSGYPPYLASVLFRHMHRQIRKSGRNTEDLCALFNIGYEDSAPMVTVGGVITDKGRALALRETVVANGMGKLMDEGRHLRIAVPPLTLKEKWGLDQLLPRDSVPTEEDVERVGFMLKPSQMEAYFRFYRYYPTFGEVSYG